MNIHQLKIFVTVYKNRSFSNASDNLKLAQPTISAHIRTLEEELECKLFDRVGKTIIPTREAEVLYGHSVTIIEKASTLRDAMGKIDIAGEIVVGASSVPGAFLMPHYVSDFRRIYPSVFFQVPISDSREVIEAITSHRLAMGIVGAKFDLERVYYAPIAEDELIIVASPHLSSKHALTLRQVIKLPMVLREEGSGTRTETERILNMRGVSLTDLKVNGIFGSMGAVKQAVKEGLGASIMSRMSVADELRHNVLKEIKVTDMLMRRQFYFAVHKDVSLPRAYDIFLKHILSRWSKVSS